MVLGRWRLESDARDELGSNHGTIAGDALFSNTATREGAFSLVLDGTDDHLIIPDHPSLTDMDAFCIAFWMRCDGLPDDSLIILEKGEAFRLTLDHSGRLRSDLATTHHPWGSPGTQVQTFESLEAGAWYHIAMGYDGSSSTIYVNGKPAGTSGEVLSGQVLNNTHDLLVGASAETGRESLAGQVDDVILFRKMPGADEISGLYAGYIPQAVIIAPESIADFDGDGVEPVTLDAAESTDPDGSIVSFVWSVDGQPAGSGEILETDLGLGMHTVILSITDNNGIISTDSTTIVITEPQFSRWKLELNAWDSRGNNHGMLSGDRTFVSGEVMEDTFALYFDGIDDHVTIPDHESLDGMDQFCYSFWVKPGDIPSGKTMVIGKEEVYRVLLTPTGRFIWAIATEDHPWSSPGTAISGYDIIEPDQWNHVVAGYDGNQTYIYRNGQLDMKSNPLSGRIVDNDRPLVFAKGNHSDADYFEGTLDDVRYFRYMLSDSSIQQLYSLYPLIDNTSSGPVDTLTSVAGTGIPDHVLLYPNPASGQVTIKGLPPFATIALYSLQGEQLFAELQYGNSEHNLDVSPFPPGIYILKCSYQGWEMVRKLIVSPR
jgi:hypothetical protein